MSDPSELFQLHDPPPGGREALRARLARERQLPGRGRARRALGAGLAFGGACAALLLALWWRGREPAPDLFAAVRAQPPVEHYPTMVALGLVPAPREPVTAVGSPADQAPAVELKRVPVKTPSVVLYLASRRTR